MNETDEFRNFHPKKFWAEINNDKSCVPYISRKDWDKIDGIIPFLKKPRCIADMIEDQGLRRGEVVRCLTLIRDIRGVILDRTEIKGVCYYKITDNRKPTSSDSRSN